MMERLAKLKKIIIDSLFGKTESEEKEKALMNFNLTDLIDTDKLFNELMEHVITMFYYGSRVYGTMTDKSDVDIVAIVDDDIDLSGYVNGIAEFKKDINDYQFINESTFINMVMEHHIVALEMFWLPSDLIIKGDVKRYEPYFKLDKWKLRQVVSGIASNAYAKAHKKMTVEKDYDLYRGQKSLFHSIRVMVFGIQIAKYGKIVNYQEANQYWTMIYAMKDSPWEVYKQTFKPIINQIRSELVILCPKPEEYYKKS